MISPECQLHGLMLIATFVACGSGLLYPTSSTLSLVHSLSVPVVEYLPERRILIDWCWSMGFALPAKLSSFYNIPIWPGKAKRSLLDNEVFAPGRLNDTHLELYRKYQGDEPMNSNKHPKDFTAGELYQSFEDVLHSYGFHDTCLLRMVCELARHPFEDSEENVFTNIITFLLTPSLHQGFTESEALYRDTYEQAEMHGFLGEDCSALFGDCKSNILDSLTKVKFD